MPQIVVAADDASIRAMMIPYLHELTPGGPTTYPQLDLYWEDTDRTPYLLRLGAQDIGFALVREHMHARLHEMAEFYVVRSHRRSGCGGYAARLLFGQRPGLWHLQVLEDNAVARAFWRSVVPHEADEARHVASNGRRFVVLQFRVPAPPGGAPA